MQRIKEEQFDFLRLNNLQDKVNFNKKANSSNWDTNEELMQFSWVAFVEKFDYWQIIYKKFLYFLIETGQIYV
ncbi:MAG: hypothetical protein MSA89_04310 [Clostridium sp.]|nr:hypothetical protein [Clostridium sp.]